MAPVAIPLLVLHVAACLAVTLVLGQLGGTLAQWLRQPRVIGEVTAGLLLGPALMWAAGPRVFDLVLPAPVLDHLGTVAQAGLALFLVGTVHELRRIGRVARGAGTLGWVVGGALVPPMLSGFALFLWILHFEDPQVRGTAPLAVLGLFTAVALTITAVPVLARILTDRGLTNTASGRLALTSAIVVDGIGWMLLAVVLGLQTGVSSGFARMLVLFTGGLALALLTRRLLASGTPRSLCLRFPLRTAVLLGVVAVSVGLASEHWGLTLPVGAALAALAIPASAGSPWIPVVARLSSVGSAVVPVFFVVTGITVFVSPLGSAPWSLIVVATGLAVLGKVLGGYVGGRLGGESRPVSARVGVLLNTRGLTELVVLQIGFNAGVVTSQLFLALVVMALVTTALTSPLLSLLDRFEALREGPPERSQRQETVP